MDNGNTDLLAVVIGVVVIAFFIWLLMPTRKQAAFRKTPEGKRRTEQAYGIGFIIGMIRRR